MSFQRCAECARITTKFALSAEFEGAEIAHHANFSALEQSAAAGCDLCRLLRQYLIHHAPTDPNSQTKVEDINDPIKVGRPKGYNALVLQMGPITCPIQDGNASEAGTNGKESLSDAKPIHRFTAESCERDVDELVKEVIRPWINRCFLSTGLEKPPDDLHRFCVMKNGKFTIPRKYDIPSLPTRVIDVEGNNQTPYLRVRQPWTPHDEYERDPDCAHYLILSYCWGRTNEAAKTTKANLQERMEKLDISSFPKTIRDAIRLTKALGERYLWVDAVCIIQSSDGDNSDWEAEAPHMGDYYGNALCTIAAAGAADSADGCFLERTAQRFPVTSCTLSSWVTTDKKETIYIHPSTPLWWNAVINSPLYQRGWAVQERALSPRRLYWTMHAVYLECQGMRASEYRPDGLTVAESIAVHENLQKEVHMNLGSMMRYSRREILCWSWYRLIERYCWTHFTYTSDKLVALSGIARRANTYHPDRYAAGLWSENLVEGLAWHTRYYEVGGPQRPTTYVAPSWSWASVDAIVKFAVVGVNNWEWSATVVDVTTVPTPSSCQARSASSSYRREYWRDRLSWRRRDRGDNNTYGRISGGERDRGDDNIYGSISGGVLHIEGIVRDLCFSIEPKTSDPTCLFYASPDTDITTRFGSESPETVLLDAPWVAGKLSLQTFRCLLLGRRMERMDKSHRGRPVMVGYVILEKTGRKPEYYTRVGWAEVLEGDYDRLLQETGRETVQIV